MEINSRQQWLTLLAIVGVALFAGDRLLLTPLTAAWRTRAARVADLRKEVQQGKSALEREASIRQRWEQIRRAALPSTTSSAEQTFFRTVDQWSRESGVTINALTPQWKRDSDQHMTLQCRIDAAGNVGTLSRFIYSIERDPLAVKIENLELGARDKEGQQLSLAVQVSALILLPQPK